MESMDIASVGAGGSVCDASAFIRFYNRKYDVTAHAALMDIDWKPLDVGHLMR